MKLLKILMIITGSLIFSACTSTMHIIAHVDLQLESPCVFEKFTESEKDTITEDVGKKIYRNQLSCEIHSKANYARIQAHNNAHKN